MPNLVRQWWQHRKKPYRIRYLGLFTYLYSEGDRRVKIAVEEGSGNPLGDILIDRSFIIHWNAPHEDELISETKQEEILESMLTYLRKSSSFGGAATPYGVISKPYWEQKERQAAIKAQEAKAKQRVVEVLFILSCLRLRAFVVLKHEYFRVGVGYDSHRLVEGRPLILGGVTIPFEKGLQGHSDADALLHAMSDALLGACGLPDIGQLFPDTSAQWKDADSWELLRAIAGRATESGWRVVNVDAVVVAQRPKIAPFVPQMKERIASALEVEVEQVNVRGKTAEGVD